MNRLGRIGNELFAFVIDTFFTYVYVCLLLIPVFGTFIYRSHVRQMRQILAIKNKVDRRKVKTVTEWERDKDKATVDDFDWIR